MRRRLLVTTLLLCAVIGILVFGIITVNAAPPTGFVYRQGTQFMLNGQAFYFAGCNAYDMFTYGDDSHPEDIENKYIDKAKIDQIMGQMQSIGVKVVRTWGFNHQTWHGFESAKGVYFEPEFSLFDYIMYSAQQHGMKVIITLENFWSDYGGIDQRLAWEGLAGGAYSARCVFYTNAGCITQYKNYFTYFANRINHYTGIAYKNDPTVFAWELMNEPRDEGIGEDLTGTTLRAWIDNVGGVYEEYRSEPYD